MIDNERVRDMTWLSVFEKREGRKVFKMTKYFRRDYIGLHLLKGFVAGTLTYLLAVALWGVFNMEPLMETIHTMDIPAFGRQLLLIYILFMAVYMAIILVYAEISYHRARKRVKAYSKRLKHMTDRLV